MNTRAARGLLAVTSLTSVVSLTLLLAWGPLTPPGGAVSSTAKPLSEVEPRVAINATNTPGDADSLYKISTPGSYYLTGNVTGVSGKHGIEIAVGGVTVDLMGFELVGVAGSLDGVSATLNNLINVTVVNGTIRSWGNSGVDLNTFSAVSSRVDSVLCSANGAVGIGVGIGSLMMNCTAYNNTGHGFVTSSGCTISDCAAYNNTGYGFAASSGNTLSACTSSFNNSNGIAIGSGSTLIGCAAYGNSGNGITASSGCTVVDCVARTNSLDGILCSLGCVIRNNACHVNGSGAGDGAGIHASSSDNRIEGNICIGADRGIDVDFAGNLIIRNSCSGNTTNWDIAGSNRYGPIIDISAGGAAAVVGSAAASTLTSTDPNANFTY